MESRVLGKAFFRVQSELYPHGSSFVPDPADVMLVSYPKSGNTWVRALVANVIQHSPSLQKMESLIPDIYRARGLALRNAYRFPCTGRLIKSHESFRPTYKRVIYIVRDPRDVCVSYYHYLRKIKRGPGWNDLSFEDFVALFVDGDADRFGTWSEHVQSWKSAEEAEMLNIRYEGMLEDPEGNLQNICDFLNLACTPAQIRSAVSACAIESLRAKEKKERSAWSATRNADPSAHFFRQGGAKNWNDEDRESIAKIETKWGAVMERLGYV